MAIKHSGDETRPPARVVWEGTSLEVLRSFPVNIMRDLGQELFRVQLGERPLTADR